MDQQSNKNLVILITGASKGIGRATAELLRKKGYLVYGTSRKGVDIASLNTTMSTNDLPLVKLDVSSNESVKTCVDGVIQREGRIDVLINNAGFGLSGAVVNTSLEEAKKQFETNFFGMLRMVNATLPLMLERDSGAIINIGSFAGRVTLLYQAFYSASKAAIGMYTDGLRMQLKHTGIKVSLIEPGHIRTAFQENRYYINDFDKDPRAKIAIDVMGEMEAKAPKPIIVAKTVEKIIKKKKVKPRYIVGRDAQMYEILRRIGSDRLRERITFRYFKLKHEKMHLKKFNPRKEKFVVLITGASSGIGKATAEYLTQKGFIVYGTSRKGSSLKEIEKEHLNKNPRPLLQLDVNDDNSVKRCVNEILEQEGKIDVLINNAGFPLMGLLWKTPLGLAYQQFETNFFGVHRMIRAVIPQMIERETGCIINVGSIAGRLSLPHIPLYSASKAALALYTDALRMETKHLGIKVSLIEPGYVKTDFNKKTIIVSRKNQAKNETSVGNTSKTKRKRASKGGVPPIKVSKVIEKAIRSKHPKPRYSVGRDAWAIKKIQTISSWQFQERIILRMFKKQLKYLHKLQK